MKRLYDCGYNLLATNQRVYDKRHNLCQSDFREHHLGYGSRYILRMCF